MSSIRDIKTGQPNEVAALTSRIEQAANIKLIDLTPERVSTLRPITVLDIFDGMSEDFHEDGLFSVKTFGRAGSDERNTRFSYIDIKVEIFHPFVHKTLCMLKGLYKGIMAGKAYAIWDEKLADFESSDIINGQTGYHFFMQHWKNIQFKRTGSYARDARIKTVTKFRDLGTATTTKILVLPAGLRDIRVEDGGRIKQGEINDLYRPIIQAANSISASSDIDTPIIDVSRNNLQNSFNAVFEYVKMLIEGKGGYIQSRWGSRAITNGTRNVITAMDTSVADLDAPNNFGIDSTGVGLFQTIKAVLPVAQHHLLTGFLSRIFNVNEGNAYLVNPVSYRRELVHIDSKTIDRWTTSSGIEKVINLFDNADFRTKPVMVEERYIALIYKGPDNTFKIFGDLEDMPTGDNFDRKYVHPLTLAELLYLCNYSGWNTYPMMMTRYPISGQGSIYSSYIYCKTTVDSEMRRELDDSWQPIPGPEHLALEFPIIENGLFINSLIPHTSRLARLGGDFDGDTMSANALYSDEACEEAFLETNMLRSYVTPAGGLINSASTDTVSRILFNMTGN